MTGKVTSRDMKQLINQQVDAYRYLADYLGTDVASAMEQVKAGTVKWQGCCKCSYAMHADGLCRWAWIILKNP